MAATVPELTLWLLNRVSAYDLRYSPDQPREPNGQFGEGGAEGNSAQSVRESLSSTTSIGQLNSAASAEARRITGRDIGFNMQGADLSIAQEHTEGVLRGLERTPSAPLQAVGTYGPGGSLGPQFDDPGNSYEENGTIGFNNGLSGPGQAASYRAELSENGQTGFSVGSDPMAVGVHEFGHVASSLPAEQIAQRLADGEAAHFGQDPGTYIGDQISTYASASRSELTAEAFTDVVVNGSSASGLSKAIYKVVLDNVGAA